MIDDMLKRTQKIINGCKHSYVLFGHSMGSKIAYDIYLELVEKQVNAPQCIFFSGCTVHSLENKYKELYCLPETEFEKEYVELGGIPEEALLDEDFKQIIFYISIK